MKTFTLGRIRFSGVLGAATVLLVGLPASPAFADFISMTLGAAGPANWTVLETGSGNISMSNASNAGFITGDIGVNGGNFGDSGVPITGNVVAGAAATLNPNVAGNVTGTITTNQSLLTTAVNDATSASTTFAGMAAAGGGSGVASIVLNNAGTVDLNAGVYDLTDLQLNGTVIVLDGPVGSTYLFNISGQLSLNSSKIVLAGGVTANDVVFDITGTQGVQLSGGLNNESVLTGIVLAPDAQVSLSPGALTGEIISGQNINIASGGSVASPPVPVPDGGMTLMLLGGALVGLETLRRRLHV